MGICQSKNDLDKYDDSLELFSLDKNIVDVKIVRVYDGDTCFGVFLLQNRPVKYKIRMFGYDSPEMKPLLKTPNRDKEIIAAHKAKQELEKLVLNKIVKLECGKWDKYGRLLGKLYINYGTKKQIDVNNHMVVNGFGYEYKGGTKKVIEY